jgi:hypothetical protein
MYAWIVTSSVLVAFIIFIYGRWILDFWISCCCMHAGFENGTSTATIIGSKYFQTLKLDNKQQLRFVQPVATNAT